MQEIQYEYECQTIHEAEKIIYDLAINQVPQKEILKIKIFINGNPYPLNPVKISKIKHRFENTENSDGKKRPEIAMLFKLFKKQTGLRDAIIKTELDPDFVESVYKRYLKTIGISTIATSYLNELWDIALLVEQSINPNATEDDVGWDELVGNYRELATNYLKRNGEL